MSLDRNIGRTRSGAAPEIPQKPIASPEVMLLAENFAALRKQASLSLDDPYFADVETLATDKATVLSLEREFEKKEPTEAERQIKTLSEAFEYVVYERINKSGWFGENIRAQLTTPYDDYGSFMHGGLDLYLEDITRGANRPFGIELDATFSTDEKTIGNKIWDLKNKLLDRGKLCSIRYYKPLAEGADTEKPKKHTEISLPKVVVGIDKNETIQAIQSLAKTDSKEKDWRTGFTVMYQVIIQLRAFKEYSERISKDRPRAAEAAKKYGEALEDMQGLFENVYTSMNLDPEGIKKIASMSPVTQAIQKKLREILGTL